MPFYFIIFLILISHTSLAKQNSQSSDLKYAPLKLFAESLNLIEKYHPSSKKRSSLIASSIRGMLFDLDPYSHFLTQEELMSFNEDKEEEYIGLGIEILMKDKKWTVTSVYKNTNNSKKMQVGDVITHVNNKNIENLSFDSVQTLFKGVVGSHKQITIKRKNHEKPIQVQLEISNNQIPSVEVVPINSDFIYARIFSFKKSSYYDFKKALRIQRCPSSPHWKQCSLIKKGLILDLRENSGGLIDPALIIADLFIPEGLMVSIRSKDPSFSKKFRAKELGSLKDFPILVLIDQRSASASELVAAALVENKRALIAGERSFGKGSIQTIFHFKKGGALKLTVAHYFTPKGNKIEGQGIQPDILLNPGVRLLSKKNRIKIKNYQTYLRQINPIQSLQKTGVHSTKNSFKKWNRMKKNDKTLNQAEQLIRAMTL